jgi:histidinol phosphatase-like enzyme (inositol monophosphatase family)
MATQVPSYREFLIFAERMADETGEMLLAASTERPNVELKPDASFATDIDKAIEKRMREMIEAKYPAHGICGEEFENTNMDAEFTWVLDPIDGTAHFIAGLPVYGSLIALAWEKRPFLGVINHPVTADRWTGVVGEFAKRNGKPVSVRACSKPDKAFATCSNPDQMSETELVRFNKLRKIVPYVQYGGSCFAYGLLASGRVDSCIDGGFEPYDYFANAAVIAGAGGYLTDWDGNEVTLDWFGNILASGDKRCHDAVIKLLKY